MRWAWAAIFSVGCVSPEGDTDHQLVGGQSGEDSVCSDGEVVVDWDEPGGNGSSAEDLLGSGQWSEPLTSPTLDVQLSLILYPSQVSYGAEGDCTLVVEGSLLFSTSDGSFAEEFSVQLYEYDEAASLHLEFPTDDLEGSWDAGEETTLVIDGLFSSDSSSGTLKAGGSGETLAAWGAP